MPRPEGPPSTRFRFDPERRTERVDVERWRKAGAVAATNEEEEDDAGTVVVISVAMAARYWMTFLVFSVFPAPDSPLREPKEETVRERERERERDRGALMGRT